MLNQESVEELRKPIIRKLEKGKLCTHFSKTICGADLADMPLISRISFFIMRY